MIGSDSSPAAKLVLRCLQSRFDPERKASIRAIAREGLDFEEVRMLARIHRVRAVTFGTLREICSDLLDSTACSEIDQFEHGLSAHASLITNELLRIIDRFEERNVPVLPFKGPVLAQRAYGALRLRSFGDIDLLIPPGRFGAARSVLGELDYRPETDTGSFTAITPKQSLKLHFCRQTTFQRGNNAFFVDLHTGVMPARLNYDTSFEQLLERTEEVKLNGRQVRAIGSEDLVEILCLHGAKNFWRRMKYVCDLGELLHTADLDWPALLKRAHTQERTRMLAAGLLLVREVLDVSISSAVIDQLSPSEALKDLAARWSVQLKSVPHRPGLSFPERIRMQLALQDRWRQKARYVSYALARRALTAARML